MKTPEEACKVVDNFIANAKEVMLGQMERGLRDICKLRWWQIGRAQQIAEKALGIGRYRNTYDKRGPKTLLGFMMAVIWFDLTCRYRGFKFRTGISEWQRRFRIWRYNLGKPPGKRVDY